MSARRWHEEPRIFRTSKYRRGGRFRNFVPQPRAFSANPAQGKCQTAFKDKARKPEFPDF
ncbi:MAG: hypothetical protein EOR71_01845 [Mesorhizobium sp.]|nr:MAG: hypothetical protein EOR71_01845 [Mesorhizobium sp.]